MNTESWRGITGYEGRYEVSDLGRVRSLARMVSYEGCLGGYLLPERVLKSSVKTNGYAGVVLCREGHQKDFCVHVLVALAFLGPRPTPEHEVNHLFGDKQDNRPDKIEWATKSRNAQHAYDTGLNPGRGAHRVSCPELGLATVGTRSMARACRELGYPKVNSADIYTTSHRGCRHWGLRFFMEEIK